VTATSCYLCLVVDTASGNGTPDDSDLVWRRLIEQQRWYSAESSAAQRAYKRVKLLQIVVGAAVPVAALIAPQVATAVIAAIVVVAESLQQLFRWHTDWLLYRSTSEALKHEQFQYLARIGPYRGDDRHTVLAERIEALLSSEQSRWAGDHASEPPSSTSSKS
jgi:hypothetical protein